MTVFIAGNIEDVEIEDVEIVEIKDILIEIIKNLKDIEDAEIVEKIIVKILNEKIDEIEIDNVISLLSDNFNYSIDELIEYLNPDDVDVTDADIIEIIDDTVIYDITDIIKDKELSLRNCLKFEIFNKIFNLI